MSFMCPIVSVFKESYIDRPFIPMLTALPTKALVGPVNAPATGATAPITFFRNLRGSIYSPNELTTLIVSIAKKTFRIAYAFSNSL